MRVALVEAEGLLARTLVEHAEAAAGHVKPHRPGQQVLLAAAERALAHGETALLGGGWAPGSGQGLAAAAACCGLRVKAAQPASPARPAAGTAGGCTGGRDKLTLGLVYM